MQYVLSQRKESRGLQRGGLDVLKEETKLEAFIKPLNDAGCRISLFISTVPAQVEAVQRVGAAVVELHTGAYCDYYYESKHSDREAEFKNLKKMCGYAHSMGFEVHAGYGLTYETVSLIAASPELKGLNIGHFLISNAVFNSLGTSIKKMKKLIEEARIT